MKNLFRKLLGDQGERAAIRYLRKQGFRILERQHRNSFGEIDIVAKQQSHVVFVEVKTRSSSDLGQPFEAVDQAKQQKITRAALAWLKKRRRLTMPSRFDVVSIVWPDQGGEPEIRHFRNAFEAIGKGQLFS